MLLSVKVAKTKGKINLAKPILMLAIINEIEDGRILNNQIKYDASLIMTYKTLFYLYTKDSITSPTYPYYYLGNDGFYHLKKDKSIRTPSAKFLREHVEYAYLDEDLWDLLQDAEVRQEYKEAIIKYFIKPKD